MRTHCKLVAGVPERHGLRAWGGRLAIAMRSRTPDALAGRRGTRSRRARASVRSRGRGTVAQGGRRRIPRDSVSQRVGLNPVASRGEAPEHTHGATTSAADSLITRQYIFNSRPSSQ